MWRRRVMAIDLTKLFSVIPSSDSSVKLVRSLMKYPETNDNVVIRIRKATDGLTVDDGGDMKRLVSAAGGNLQTVAVQDVLKYCRTVFGVKMQEDGRLVFHPADETKTNVNWAVIQVAHTAISVFSAATMGHKRGKQ